MFAPLGSPARQLLASESDLSPTVSLPPTISRDSTRAHHRVCTLPCPLASMTDLLTFHPSAASSHGHLPSRRRGRHHAHQPSCSPPSPLLASHRQQPLVTRFGRTRTPSGSNGTRSRAAALARQRRPPKKSAALIDPPPSFGPRLTTVPACSTLLQLGCKTSAQLTTGLALRPPLLLFEVRSVPLLRRCCCTRRACARSRPPARSGR